MSSVLHNQIPTDKMGMMNRLGEYLNKQFLKWQFDSGKRKTQEEFAAYLGMSRPFLTMLINGDRQLSDTRLKRLADLLDDEIYDAAGKSRPDPFVEYASSVSSRLKDAQKRKIQEQMEKYITSNEKESSTT